MKRARSPTSKEEAAAWSVRPLPEKYDPDCRSHWSITMMVAWITWRTIDAVRIELDDYRRECFDWKWLPAARNKLLIPELQEELKKESQWHLEPWPCSGWSELRKRARSENKSLQAAIDLLWRAAGEDQIKATARQCKNIKTFDGDRIGIPADDWPDLKRIDDEQNGKAMLLGPDGRVYRDVQFSQLGGKKLWSPPKSPTPTTASKEEGPQSKRARRYIDKHFGKDTDGVMTATIRKKLAEDKDLKAELLGRAVPSATVINRVLGRRKK